MIKRWCCLFSAACTLEKVLNYSQPSLELRWANEWKWWWVPRLWDRRWGDRIDRHCCKKGRQRSINKKHFYLGRLCKFVSGMLGKKTNLVCVFMILFIVTSYIPVEIIFCIPPRRSFFWRYLTQMWDCTLNFEKTSEFPLESK